MIIIDKIKSNTELRSKIRPIMRGKGREKRENIFMRASNYKYY
jgi:hypothetical protein